MYSTQTSDMRKKSLEYRRAGHYVLKNYIGLFFFSLAIFYGRQNKSRIYERNENTKIKKNRAPGSKVGAPFRRKTDEEQRSDPVNR